MRHLGVIATNTMARPQRTLNDDEAAKIVAIMKNAGL